ncbi:unnamed protein product [Pieris macdunnoughi]|uniref:Uncharacterized protein n=1 Tax=Pieris macdunnoughi TaxID=345717 RepID=A0A821XNV1_9NEOP|nr:unnamed protein product [Pieris macdunnoughi]
MGLLLLLKSTQDLQAKGRASTSLDSGSPGSVRDELRNNSKTIHLICHILQTTTFRPRAAKKGLRTDETALKIVADNIDVNNMDSRDWLAIEVAVGRLKTKEENVKYFLNSSSRTVVLCGYCLPGCRLTVAVAAN